VSKSQQSTYPWPPSAAIVAVLLTQSKPQSTLPRWWKSSVSTNRPTQSQTSGNLSCAKDRIGQRPTTLATPWCEPPLWTNCRGRLVKIATWWSKTSATWSRSSTGSSSPKWPFSPLGVSRAATKTPVWSITVSATAVWSARKVCRRQRES